MSKRPMPPPPASRAPTGGGDPQLHTQDDNNVAENEGFVSNRPTNEPDALKANESKVVNVKSASDEESARRQREQEEAERKKKEEEDEDKPPCCTKKCACLPFVIFGYFLLFIFMIVGLAVSFAFIIVHFVMRLLHLVFWGLAQIRHSVDDALDIEKLQEDHHRQYEQDQKEWEHRQKMKEHEKNKAAAERQRQGKKPKKYEEESDEEAPPEPNLRVCSFGCVGKSTGACIGMSFNGMAYMFFVLAFMFGFSSIAIFTTIFSSCTTRGVSYLSEFRRKYDLDLAASEASKKADAEK